MAMASVRYLKIKTSTCKRLVKELSSYEKEVQRESAKTADMKEKGADPYDLKQQENVLAESRMMVPDCRKRLEAALEDLKGTLGRGGVPGRAMPKAHKFLPRMLVDTGYRSLEHPKKLICDIMMSALLPVELEETDGKEGPEFEEARNIITDVEKFFESSEV